MKNSIKKIAVIVALATNLVSFGQDKPTTTTTTTTTTTISTETNKPTIFIKKHEWKVDMVKLLSVPAFGITYEYVKNKDFAYGTSIVLNMGKKEELGDSFSITPFGRFYFQETKEYGSKGFFVEGFAKIADVRYDANNPSNSIWNWNIPQYKDYTQFAIGFALGKKWVNSSGFVFEMLAGIGRPLNAPTDAPTGTFRGDFSVGYRF